MTSDPQPVVRICKSVGGIDPGAWDRCANPDPVRYNPFVAHAFLKTLEDAGNVGPGTGWMPHPIVLESDGGRIAGVAPAYLKSHSQGEYVFDYAWADAYERAGGRYYPKLLVAVPFTPVPGPRLLAGGGAGADERALILAAAVASVVEQNSLSSAHITFCASDDMQGLARLGYLHRTGQQFHWTNQGYATFDEFLATFSSRKRKAVRKERAAAVADGIAIEHVTGRDITEVHLDAMFAFYRDTSNRKWGRPYLNRAFFALIAERMAERVLLILAKREGRYIAGAFNMIGGDCLYGRYWGAIEHHDFLHFEVCYYQAIDFAITHGLARVAAGAQGDHKLARGYLPVTTHSLHWIADDGFRRGVERFLQHERAAVVEENAALTELGPYKCLP